MARSSLVLFAITAMLAPRVGHAVSLKYSEDRNSFGDSSLAMDMSAKKFPWFKNTFPLPANKGSPTVPVAPVVPVAEVKPTAAPQAPKLDPGAIMFQLTVQVNKTLTNLDSTVISFVDNMQQKKMQLLAKVNTTWPEYVTQLQSTLLDVELKVGGALGALQALIDLLVPAQDAPTDGTGPMSFLADSLHEAARLAGTLLNSTNPKDLTYKGANLTLNAINSTLYDGMAKAFLGTSILETEIVQLADRMLGALQQLPLPDVVFSTTREMFDMAKETVKTFHVQVDRGVTVFVSGVEESSFSEFETVPESIFLPESSASRVAPLLAAMLAVGAIAFH